MPGETEGMRHLSSASSEIGKYHQTNQPNPHIPQSTNIRTKMQIKSNWYLSFFVVCYKYSNSKLIYDCLLDHSSTFLPQFSAIFIRVSLLDGYV